MERRGVRGTRCRRRLPDYLPYVAPDIVAGRRMCFTARVAPGPGDGVRGLGGAKVGDNIVRIDGVAARDDLANLRSPASGARRVDEWRREWIAGVANVHPRANAFGKRKRTGASEHQLLQLGNTEHRAER